MSWFNSQWLTSQFTALPYPSEDCSGKTVIVTGSNSGLGLETARHFTRLNAAKIILACRSTEKAEAAKDDIESSTGRKNVVECWSLDLASFESVKEFASRAEKLKRLDAVVLNASVAISEYILAEGHELSMTVNVLSTFLLAMRLLPTMQNTATQFNCTPHLVVVSSDACAWAQFKDRGADNIYQALDDNRDLTDRYNVTKLMQVIIATELANAVGAKGPNHVIINSLTPGLCRTQLFRHLPPLFAVIANLILFLVGRTAEMGSRCIMGSAFADWDCHGSYMWDCRPYRFPPILDGSEGEQLRRRVWDETLALLEEIEPGVTKVVV